MAGCQIGKEHQKLVAWKVIPRPSDFVEDTFVTHKAEEPKKPDPDPTPEPPVETPEEAAGDGEGRARAGSKSGGNSGS